MLLLRFCSSDEYGSAQSNAPTVSPPNSFKLVFTSAIFYPVDFAHPERDIVHNLLIA
jgi:hypothetical protein